MQDIIKGHPQLIDGLAKLCPNEQAIKHTSDLYGNGYHWFRLTSPHNIKEAARILKGFRARLAMISAYTNKEGGDEAKELCYHFDVEGTIYNLTVAQNREWPIVPSITPEFANADWHEREMMELYSVQVTDHPNPKRLFLDEKLDAGLLATAVPLSVMMNGASSKDLWERILSEKEQQK
ncbi:MAG: NADH-quinone oxidoreductase subunit C [Desulfovibrionaceae bacterium]|nr:NADH-quinone oxidoreductase subunit C [Desulfovibrionaceae bacterium]